MKGKWKSDFITGIVVIISFLIYYWQTFSIRQTALVKLSSTFIPRLCAAAGILFGLIIVFYALRDRKAESITAGNVDEAAQADAKAKTLAAILSFVILFIAIFFIEHVGFVWGAAFYLMATFLQCSKYLKKNWPLFVVMAIVPSVLIYMAFGWGFHLRLPAGFLGLLGGIL